MSANLTGINSSNQDISDLPKEVNRIIDSFFDCPIKLDTHGRKINTSLGSLTKGEAIVLANLVYHGSPTRSLEIGLANGSSCIAIAGARKQILSLHTRHITLDPYQQDFGSLGLLEIEKAGLGKNVTWLPERSEDFLSSAYARGERYDFVFVDGGHNIGQTVVDTFYVDKVLPQGGLVVFHDGLLFSTAAAVKYLVFDCGYSLVPLQPDSFLRMSARRLRYMHVLGTWYVRNVIPKMHCSLVALKKKGGD